MKWEKLLFIRSVDRNAIYINWYSLKLLFKALKLVFINNKLLEVFIYLFIFLGALECLKGTELRSLRDLLE